MDSAPLSPATHYDCCFAWNWQYDADFAQLLEAACQKRGLTLLHLAPENVEALTQALLDGQLRFQALFDRASDSDGRFIAFVNWARDRQAHAINRFKLARRAWNKIICHWNFIRAGLRTPHTIILPAYHEQVELPPIDLSPLGDRFSIKPAHGGGGVGVVAGATYWEQALAVRQEFPDDQYLLQAYVVPAVLEGREAWFRIIFCDGQIYPCWWDTCTHVYTPLTADEEGRYSLAPLREITATIAGLCALDLFSTEIALSLDGLFISVDYVNDPIDLRLKSKAADGVPDEIMRDIAERLAGRVAAYVARRVEAWLPDTAIFGA